MSERLDGDGLARIEEEIGHPHADTQWLANECARAMANEVRAAWAERDQARELVESWKEVALRIGLVGLQDQNGRLRQQVAQLREALRDALGVADTEAEVAHAGPATFTAMDRLYAVLEATAPQEER